MHLIYKSFLIISLTEIRLSTDKLMYTINTPAKYHNVNLNR